MKRFITLLAGTLLGCFGYAQNLAAQFLLDARDGEFASAVSTRIATLEDFLNVKGLNPDFSALVGVKFKTNQTVGGFSVVFNVPIGKNLILQPGGALLFQQKTPTSLGVVLGATIVQSPKTSFTITGSPMASSFGLSYNRRF